MDSLPNLSGLDRHKTLFYTEGCRLYKLDVEAVYGFLESGRVEALEEEGAFGVTLVL
jgi:hypothetical protein